MKGVGKSRPQNLNVKRKDLGQFVEKASSSFILRKEESKMYDSVQNGMTAVHDNHSFFGMNRSDFNAENQNWYELRLAGKYPERRAYHSSFLHNKK